MIERLKDSALSQALTLAIGTYLQGIGEVRNLHLDTRKKSIELSLLLRGEASEITVRIEEYEIFEENDRHYLRARRLSSSRKWIELLADRHLPKLRVELPARYARMLKKIV